MPRDGLRRLPDLVVEPLLRAMMAIPPRADRLLLRRSDRARPPTRHISDDYNVILRDGAIGRIRTRDYTGYTSGEMMRGHLAIIAKAAQHRLPAVYPFRYFALAGGLIAYGADQGDQYRRAAGYADRILKGEKPGDLPIP